MEMLKSEKSLFARFSETKKIINQNYRIERGGEPDFL